MLVYLKEGGGWERGALFVCVCLCVCLNEFLCLPVCQCEVVCARVYVCLEFGKSQRGVENREKMEKTGCKIICGAPTTLAVKGLMMMMMMMMMMICVSVCQWISACVYLSV